MSFLWIEKIEKIKVEYSVLSHVNQKHFEMSKVF